MGKQIDLLQGTLDMLILKAVSLGPLHGYGVLLRIQQISGEQLQGSLYPGLYRLEHQGWMASEWSESENKRKAKFYNLTATGRRQLHSETENWNSHGVLDRRHSTHDPGGDMNLLAPVRSWLKGIVKRRQLETDMEAEALFHMENRAEDLARTGVRRPEAMRRARIEFGGVESHQDAIRASIGLRFWDQLGGIFASPCGSYYWPNQSAVGKRLRVNDDQGREIEIVGIAKASTYLRLGEGPTEYLYLPWRRIYTRA